MDDKEQNVYMYDDGDTMLVSLNGNEGKNRQFS